VGAGDAAAAERIATELLHRPLEALA